MIEITSSNIMLVVAVMLMMSVFVGKAGSRFGMPALLLFLGVGMVAGVDGFGLHFDSAASAQFVGMIALSIILFTGGLETRFSDIRPVLFPGITLATVGVLLTTGLTGTFIYYVFHWLVPEYSFGWAESMLIAAIMSSTDSASVFSIFDSAKLGLKQKLRPTLDRGQRSPRYRSTTVAWLVGDTGSPAVVWSCRRPLSGLCNGMDCQPAACGQ